MGGKPVHIGPVVLVACAAVNVAGLVVNLAHPGALHLFAAGFVLLNLAWLLMEAPITFSRPTTQPREVATLATYGAARTITVAAAVLGPIAWPRLSPVQAIPVLIFLAGVVLRTVAVRTLGQFYSHHVIRRDDHAIVHTGPYPVVRHPAYAGMLIGHLGLVLFLLNWASVLALAVVGVVISWRIRGEERELLVI